MSPLLVISLFSLTALAEILGCWLVWLWMRQSASVWCLVPAALSLAVFAGLLTLHPAASGRVYAAYGGIYVLTALAWLWAVDGIRPNRFDAAGGVLILVGALTIVVGNWPKSDGVS